MAGHWKKMMDDKEMLYAHDLDNRDVTITIEKVVGGELRGENNKKSKKPIAHIKGKIKKLALNVTNCRTIEQLYGTPDPAEWSGIRVTIFPTTTDFGGKTVECIRIRPYLPKGKEETARQQRVAEAVAESRKHYRPPSDTMELDDNERRWLAEAGRPRFEGDTMGPADDEYAIIDAAALKEGLISGG